LRNKFTWIAIVFLALVCQGCTRTTTGAQPWRVAPDGDAPSAEVAAPNPVELPGTRVPGASIFTPTPDPPLQLPTPRTETEAYYVQRNDSLGLIARRYNVDLASLIEINNIANPDQIEVGQYLIIPAPTPGPPGPSFKVIPDSELVYGPASAAFDLAEFVKSHDGYLSHYTEEVDEREYSGAEVVAKVAMEYSVNPRLLLAVLEYRSGWVTKADPAEISRVYPILYFDPRREGLYRQLAWSANNLNRGFYLWRAGGIPNWILQDGSIIPIANTLNAGTAGVQHFFSTLLERADWEQAVTERGLFSTYNDLFGYPFGYAIEPSLPPDLTQPVLQLPFEANAEWSFTGGPHGGWGEGSGWAALDFAPPGPALGCVQKDDWIVAAADGLILRADIGAVVQDLDGDGLEQTGWTLLYMHVESRDRVAPGAYLKAGERIGHASCEGGVSTGTHLHLARRYNGEWIPADGPLPFNLDGWVSGGEGYEYNGFLMKDGAVIEAWAGRRDENQIKR